MYYHYLLSVLLGLLCTYSCFAQTSDDVEVQSKAYLEAIWAADWDGMASYLTEESVYLDFTMNYFGNGEIDLVGRDSIVAFYRNANDGSGVKEVKNTIVYHFVAGNSVTYELDTFVRADGNYWGAPDTEITATFRVVSFVQMESGKVLRHIDFSDYEDAMGQISKQIEATKQN